MRTTVAIRSLLFSFALLVFSHGAFAQIGVGISVNFGPPALPVYEQPICPDDGYLWTPGYWAYDDDDGYYWVPGTWVEAPQVGYLWTPGYWGWGGSAFLFREGKVPGAVLLLIAGGVALAALILLRRSRKRPATALFLSVLWCLIDILSLFNGGVHSPAVYMALALSLDAAWLLGSSATIGFAAATLVLSLKQRPCWCIPATRFPSTSLVHPSQSGQSKSQSLRWLLAPSLDFWTPCGSRLDRKS